MTTYFLPKDVPTVANSERSKLPAEERGMWAGRIDALEKKLHEVGSNAAVQRATLNARIDALANALAALVPHDDTLEGLSLEGLEDDEQVHFGVTGKELKAARAALKAVGR